MRKRRGFASVIDRRCSDVTSPEATAGWTSIFVNDILTLRSLCGRFYSCFFCLFLLICGVCLCYGYNGYTEIFIFLLLASYKLSSLRFFNPYPRYYRYH